MKYIGKVFTRKKQFEDYDFQYPEDIKIIWDYLNSIGEVYVAPDVIEDLYYDFCEKYDAVWLNPSEFWLDRFAKWLNEIER